jgi:hypothetical protein
MKEQDSTRSVASYPTMEIVVAAVIFALGALVMYDSLRIGIYWEADGPQAGYFTFWISLLVCIPSAVLFVQGWVQRLHGSAASFVSIGQLKSILWVLLPATAFVLGIELIGIYIASALYIMLFMVLVGKYGWLRSLVVGVSVGGVAFAVFELWFRILLPKGFVERAFGF